jgi:hypothetical protein
MISQEKLQELKYLVSKASQDGKFIFPASLKIILELIETIEVITKHPDTGCCPACGSLFGMDQFKSCGKDIMDELIEAREKIKTQQAEIEKLNNEIKEACRVAYWLYENKRLSAEIAELRAQLDNARLGQKEISANIF